MHADERRSRDEVDRVLAKELGVPIERVQEIDGDPFLFSDDALMRAVSVPAATTPSAKHAGQESASREAPSRADATASSPRTSMQQRIAFLSRLSRKSLRKVAAKLRRRLRQGAADSGPTAGLFSDKRNLSTEELAQRFTEGPSTDLLSRLVASYLDVEGNVEAPLQLIRSHPELVDALTAEQRKAVERVLGKHRLATSGIRIPDRSRGAAYVAAPGRVMYCASFTPVFNSNGYATRTRGIVESLHSQGIDITVVARPGYPWDNSRAQAKLHRARTVQELNGVSYVHVPATGWRDVGMDHYVVEAAEVLVREARRLRPSVIHAASNYRTALPALIAARRLGIPFVYEVRGLWEVTEASSKPGFGSSDRFSIVAKQETIVAQQADGVLVLSEQLADELVRRGVEREKIELAPNAVDPAVFLPNPRDDALAQKHGIREDVPIIGFAGSMASYEGLDVLVEASKRLMARGVDHQVVIAGSGAVEKSLRSKIERESIVSVKFLGRLPMDEIPGLLSTFDVVALPRLPLPVTELVPALKPLEAAGAGKALVLSEVAPHRTVAGNDSERALLFRAGDVEGLADALQRVVEDKELRESLARNARDWTLSERNWEAVARRILPVYTAATNQHTAAVTSRPGKRLTDIRLGALRNGATVDTLRNACHVLSVSAESAIPEIDVLVVEASALSSDDAMLLQLLGAVRDQGIPAIFLQDDETTPEDGESFSRYVNLAREFDFVVCTDARQQQQFLRAGVTGTTSLSPAIDASRLNPVALDGLPKPVQIEAGHGVSPTVYPRAAVESAASGHPIVASESLGLRDTFEQVLPSSANETLRRGFLSLWSSSREALLAESWRQLRAVHRSYGADMMLAVLLRSAGIPVELEQLPLYAIELGNTDDATVMAVLRQSQPPRAVYTEFIGESSREKLSAAGIDVCGTREMAIDLVDWIGRIDGPVGRTYFEDRLLATRFGDWPVIGSGEFRRCDQPDSGEAPAPSRMLQLAFLEPEDLAHPE